MCINDSCLSVLRSSILINTLTLLYQRIDCFSDLRTIGLPCILFYLKCCFDVFVGWFGPKPYINPDRPVHLPVNLGIAYLMVSALLVLYFWFAPFRPSGFEAFLGDFAFSAVAAVSMYPVGFSVISSWFGL